MTLRSKHYIDAGDILAVRMECKKCGATVSLTLSEDLRSSALHLCPNCSNPWLGLGNSSIASVVANFAAAHSKLAENLERWKETLNTTGQAGFELSIEIKDPIE